MWEKREHCRHATSIPAMQFSALAAMQMHSVDRATSARPVRDPAGGPSTAGRSPAPCAAPEALAEVLGQRRKRAGMESVAPAKSGTARARGRAASVRSAAAQQFDVPPRASRAPCYVPPPARPCQPTTRRRPRRLVSQWARTARATSLGSSGPPRQQRLDALHQLVAHEVAITFGFIASCEHRGEQPSSLVVLTLEKLNASGDQLVTARVTPRGNSLRSEPVELGWEYGSIHD